MNQQMDEGVFNIVLGILTFGGLIYLFILLIIIDRKYSKFMKEVDKTNPNFQEYMNDFIVDNGGGKWVYNTYWFRAPLPITLKTHNKEEKRLIDSHNSMIRRFWISFGIVLGVIFLVSHSIKYMYFPLVRIGIL